MIEKSYKNRNETAGVEKFDGVDGMRHTDLRPIVKHQQRAICTATKAEMRDSHTRGPREWVAVGGIGAWRVNKECKSVTKTHFEWDLIICITPETSKCRHFRGLYTKTTK